MEARHSLLVPNLHAQDDRDDAATTLRIFHPSFPNFSPETAARMIHESAKCTESSNSGYTHIVTGAGFGYASYSPDMTRDEFYYGEYSPKKYSYNDGITKIKDILTMWGKQFSEEIRKVDAGNILKNKTLIIGVDCGLAYSGEPTPTRDVQTALVISGAGKIHVTWKCFPVREERAYLTYPVNDDEMDGLPNDLTIQSHLVDGMLIMICYDIFSLDGKQAILKDWFYKSIHTKMIKLVKNAAISSVYCLIHTDPRDGMKMWGKSANFGKVIKDILPKTILKSIPIFAASGYDNLTNDKVRSTLDAKGCLDIVLEYPDQD